MAAKASYGKDGKVDMCEALKEMLADERMEGREEGRREGREEGRKEKIRIIVRNMINRGMQDEDIKALAECDQELIDELRKK